MVSVGSFTDVLVVGGTKSAGADVAGAVCGGRVSCVVVVVSTRVLDVVVVVSGTVVVV